MSSRFPANIDDGTTLPDPAANNAVNSPSHAGLHANTNAAVKAIETKVGTGSSTPASNTLLVGTGAGTSAWTQVTSAQLASTITDETGSGSAVFASTPTLITPKVDTINEATTSNGVTVGGVNLKGGAITTSNVVPTAALQDNAVTQSKVAVGAVVQVLMTTYGATVTGTTQIPLDNTIPQNTEGDQYMTISFTPKSATNKLIIEAMVFGAPSVAADVIAALFQDMTANALAATATYVGTATARVCVPLAHTMVAGTTSSTTFSVRVGLSTSGTFGFGASGFFGTISHSYIKVTEVKA